jgi:hypothetical protein
MTFDRNERSTQDESLRDDFRALRSDVEGSGTIPDFSRMMTRARTEIANTPELRLVDGGGEPDSVLERGGGRQRRALWAHPGTWMSAAMAAAVAGVLLIGEGRNSADADFERLVASYSADAALGAWRSPTEGLLRTPGIDLGGVPSIAPSVTGERPRLEGGRDL